jgi:hypothetical protein
MKCRHCHQEFSSKDVRCPHCGTDAKLNPITRMFRGWGIVDLILLMIAVAGLCALFYTYLYQSFLNQKEAWHVEAQAYEEVMGQVKIVGMVKNMTDKQFEGSVTLELRVFNSQAKIIYQESASTTIQVIESMQEVPFSFMIQRPMDMAFYNVKANTL